MSRIYVVEPGATGGPGAMGARILTAALRDAGHEVAALRLHRGASPALLPADGSQYPDHSRLPRPDAWFVSTLYPRQWLDLPALHRMMGVGLHTTERHAADPLVAYGGQAMLNPAPVAAFADVLALGDGEVTGVRLAAAAAGGRGHAMAWASGRAGFAVPSLDPGWTLTRIEARTVAARLVQSGTGRDRSIEVARGCRSRCAFCPIGWAGGTYRETDRAAVESLIQSEAMRSATVNLYAPDFSSLSWADDADAAAERAGCANRGKDARMDHTYRRLSAGAPPRSYSFGVEGVSERLRAALQKPASGDRIVETMAMLRDVKAVKWYMIIGLPGEAAEDWEELRGLIGRVKEVYPWRLDITLTHFQAVPHTPLQREPNAHRSDAYDAAMALRAWLAETDRGPGARVMASQPKGPELHEHDAALQRGGEGVAAYLATSPTEGSIQSGRWRSIWRDTVGADPVTSLAEVHGEPHWARVRVSPPGDVEAARVRYWKRLTERDEMGRRS